MLIYSLMYVRLRLDPSNPSNLEQFRQGGFENVREIPTRERDNQWAVPPH